MKEENKQLYKATLRELRKIEKKEKEQRCNLPLYIQKRHKELKEDINWQRICFKIQKRKDSEPCEFSTVAKDLEDAISHIEELFGDITNLHLLYPMSAKPVIKEERRDVC